MAKRVFITRDLTPDSPFLHLLSAAGLSVQGFSLLKFSAIDFLSPPSADWVFCYSARSADFFLRGLHQLGISPEQYTHYAALGPGTAVALEKKGITPAFIGSGQPEETANAFLIQAAGKRVLFPRAKQSRQSVQRLLKSDVVELDLIVYDNRIRKDLSIPDTDYVVCTSPLNVQAYFARPEVTAEQRIVAIGQTTAQALKDFGKLNFRVADQASEQALAELILDWEKSI